MFCFVFKKIFVKEGNTKLNPEVFKSQFNHVYIIVTPCVSPSGEELFKVEVVTKGLKRFLPTLPSNNVLSATQLREWLLLKLINGEVHVFVLLFVLFFFFLFPRLLQ